MELHHTATQSKSMRDEMEHISNHFTVKTGESLTFEVPGSDLLHLIGQAVGKVGEAGVMELLKKAAGF